MDEDQPTDEPHAPPSEEHSRDADTTEPDTGPGAEPGQGLDRRPDRLTEASDETPSLGEEGWLDQLAFGKRFGIAVGIPILVLVVGLVATTLQVEAIKDDEEAMSEEEQNLRDLEKLTASFADLNEVAFTYVITGETQRRAEVEARIADFQDRLNTVQGDEGLSDRRLADLDAAASSYVDQVREAATLVEQGRLAEAQSLLTGPAAEDREAIEASIATMSNTQASAFEEQAAAVGDRADNLERALWIGGAFGVALAIGSGYYMARRTRDTFAEIASVLSSGAAELSATVEQQERAASEQASSVNETTTTMEEMEASADQMKDQADSASEQSDHVLEQARHGDEVVQKTLTSMEDTQDRVDDISEQILHLSDQVDQIEDVADVVGDIASQVNMLALNASVEASRAGEEGQGFGVVAEEIRKLADQSQNEAERINEIVDEIQKATDSTVMAAEEGTKAVEASLKNSEDAAEAFDEIQEAVDRAAERTQQIALGAQEQASAVTEVYTAMNEITQGSRETASGIAQTKVLVEDLNDVVRRLDRII